MIWKYDGSVRPAFADTPEPRQESVWDYPRPPAVEDDVRRIVVRSYELLLAESTRALRVLETASAPGFYLPPEDVSGELLKRGAGESFCEWKGAAEYLDLDAPWGELAGVGWSYPNPSKPFSAIAGYIAFYPSKVQCFVDGERVQPQQGGFYGGWVTSEIAGPVKGGPGTHGW